MNVNSKTIQNNEDIDAKSVYNPFQILRHVASVTPNDSTDLSTYGIIYCKTGGDIKVDLVGSGTITYTIQDGEFLPVIVKRVYATGTNATDIYVHW